MKIDSVVVQIIKIPNFNNFTTSDVRSAYMALCKDSFLDPIIIRRKLYAELLKLVSMGWLKKKTTSKKRGTRFSKTAQFDAKKLIEHIDEKPYEITHCDGMKESLTAKLNTYKVELLLNLGENEAYKELYDEFPELVTKIQCQQNQARDNNTKILGKIKAIESLINQEKQQST
ncbi:hypothetical protein MT391_11520 [Vibrio sp. 1-Bac 57]